MAAATFRSCKSFLPRRRLSDFAALAPHPPSGSDVPSSPSSKPISQLISILRAESNPEKIIDLFQSSTHLPRFYSHRPLHQIFVKKLHLLRRPDLVERLLEYQKSDPAAPKSEGFFIRIMSLYTKASMPDHAFRTFEQIPVRTEKSLCALLAAYLGQRRFDRVRELFYSVPAELGIVPGVASHNMILTALCETGDVDAACKLLDEMRMKKNLEPGIIAYNSILNGYLKKDDKAGFVDTLKSIYSKGITPNLFTYNIRMLDFCKKSESFKAEELLDVVISKGMQPNFSAFNTVITGFCEELDFESAIRVFKKMKSMKNANGKALFSPNADTFLALICGLVDNGDFVLAQKICRECLRMKYAPPFETMKALINGLVKDSKVVDAKYLAVMMRKVAKGDALDSWTKLEAELPL
ncbi:hypothetical protein KSP40_PGU020949 [Platanthera guangdongensis]|uniref:Pentatricopeptide repeat-containing protein n=1 Tax=Platanthera guangdongensis TaxID=2320717 RepID=A0ABR2M0P1_9ASPA